MFPFPLLLEIVQEFSILLNLLVYFFTSLFGFLVFNTISTTYTFIINSNRKPDVNWMQLINY